MDRRLQLQSLLETILETDQVHFQPPPNVRMQYPAIVYNYDFETKEFADNLPYFQQDRYEVTVIDRNPDTDLRRKVSALPMCSFSRAFVSDNLNHYVYSLNF